MILDHFGLAADPFALNPDLNLLFLSQSHEETMAHLVYGLEQSEQIIMVTGDIGMGKTLALECLLSRVSSKFTTCLVNNTKVRFRELLKLILQDLELDFEPAGDVADLLGVLRELVKELAAQDKTLLLVIDEAQNLDVDDLESLRLLLGLSPRGAYAISLVLVGQPGLQDRINSPDLSQLKQRIRVHYHMGPLKQEEIKEYLNFRTAQCGPEASLFDRDAISEIFRLSKGVPRLVNHLASQGFLAAYVDGSHKVSGKHMKQADMPGEAETSKSSSQAGASAVSENVEGEGVRRMVIIGLALAVVIVVALAFLLWSVNRNVVQDNTSKNSSVSVDIPKIQQGGETQSDSIQDFNFGQKISLTPGAVYLTNLPRDAAPADNSLGEAVETSQDTVLVAPFSPIEPETLISGLAVEEEPVSPHSITPSSSFFTIHVASFKILTQAENCSLSLRGRGLDAFYLDVPATGDAPWYRVYVGHFQTGTQAEAMVERLHGDTDIGYFTIVKYPG